MIKNKMSKLAGIHAVAFITFASAVSAGGGPSISMTQTVSTDLAPMTCGTESLISVNLGEAVNFCYTVTNTGDVDFDLHDLDTSEYGSLLANFDFLLEAGQSVSINDIRTPMGNVLNEATWTANEALQDASVTVLSGVDFEFTDISGTGTSVNLEGGAFGGPPDEGEANLVIPFSFNYYGTDYTDLRVGANGAGVFGDVAAEVDFSNLELPTADLAIIAPFWDDLIIADLGDVYSQTDGVAPDRTFTVQWDQATSCCDVVATEIATFQLVLFETTNEIQFRYLDVTFGGSGAGADGGATATVGVDAGDGLNALQYSFNGSTLLTDMTTLSIMLPSGGATAESSSTAGVSLLTPQVAVNPVAIDSMVDSGGMGSDTLSIENTGQGNLDWSANDASAPAGMPLPDSFYQPSLLANQFNLPAPGNRNPKQSTQSPIQINGGGTPAFAVDVFNGQLFETTLEDANVGVDISPIAERVFTGDFMNGDFTQLYALDFDNEDVADDGDDAEDALVTINVTDGTVTTIGPVLVSTDPITENTSGLTQDPTTGTVYMTAFDGVGGVTNLYTVDLVTAATTLIGPISNVVLAIDVAVSATGQMYVHDIVSDSIFAVDKDTGAGTLIGATGFDANFAQGMAFDLSTNTLYLAAYSLDVNDYELRSVDLSTGATTLLGSIPGQNEIGAFGIAATIEPCFLDEDIAWMSLSSTSGTVGGGLSEDVTINYDATGLMDGIYNANVCVFTNDPGQPLVKVPVTLQVGPDDLIFADGFEAPAP